MRQFTVHIHTYTCHAYTYIYMHKHTYTYICIHIHIYIYVQIYIYIHIYMSTQLYDHFPQNNGATERVKVHFIVFVCLIVCMWVFLPVSEFWCFWFHCLSKSPYTFCLSHLFLFCFLPTLYLSFLVYPFISLVSQTSTMSLCLSQFHLI